MKYHVYSIYMNEKEGTTTLYRNNEKELVINNEHIKKIEFCTNFMVVTVIDEDLKQLREDCHKRIKDHADEINGLVLQFDEELISAVEYQELILEQAVAMENVVEMYHLRELDEMFADNEDGKE